MEHCRIIKVSNADIYERHHWWLNVNTRPKFTSKDPTLSRTLKFNIWKVVELLIVLFISEYNICATCAQVIHVLLIYNTHIYIYIYWYIPAQIFLMMLHKLFDISIYIKHEHSVYYTYRSHWAPHWAPPQWWTPYIYHIY